MPVPQLKRAFFLPTQWELFDYIDAFYNIKTALQRHRMDRLHLNVAYGYSFKSKSAPAYGVLLYFLPSPLYFDRAQNRSYFRTFFEKLR